MAALWESLGPVLLLSLIMTSKTGINPGNRSKAAKLPASRPLLQLESLERTQRAGERDHRGIFREFVVLASRHMSLEQDVLQQTYPVWLDTMDLIYNS